MLRRKLISLYIKQILLVVFVVVALAFAIITWMFKQYDTIQINKEFAPTGIMTFINEAEIDENGHIVSSDLLEQLKLDGGWIQSLDDNGQAIQSFFTPDDVPMQYNPVQLIDYWQGIEPFPYSLLLWIQVKDQQTYTLLYGKDLSYKQDIQNVIDGASLDNEGLSFSSSISDQLNQTNSWVQVYDKSGQEIASWNKPEGVASTYTLQDLALRNENIAYNGVAIKSYFDANTGLSWIIQYPISPNQTPFTMSERLNPELSLLLLSGFLFIIVALIILIILAIFFANRFVKPLMDIITSIEGLGKNEDIPHTLRPLKPLTSRRKQKLFGAVYDTINTVEQRLTLSKTLERKTQQERDEWIAGITHDMKTPLSSIKGYAHMLSAEQYQWTEDDVKNFSSIILDKSNYMNQLLDDLDLTYRLSNDALPVELVQTNISEFIYDAVEQVKQNSLCHNSIIEVLYRNDYDIIAPIYPAWLERIIYNLIVNAVLHNPEGTTISIVLEHIDKHTWQLSVNDNGKGMDEQTMSRLFDRYYRGTNTEQHNAGSGLGMAITKQLVQAMGGTIEVYSQIEHGTHIHLRWKL